MLGCHLNIESLFDVPTGRVRPASRVTSAVVRLDPLPPGTFDIEDEPVCRRWSRRLSCSAARPSAIP